MLDDIKNPLWAAADKLSAPFAHESDFYWGVHTSAIDLEQSQAQRGVLV